MKYLNLIIIIILLIPLSYANDYANYNKAEIELKLSSGIDLIPTGSNPKLIEAEATINLVPFEYDNQEILNIEIYSEPEAEVRRGEDKIIYKWTNIRENKIYYEIKSNIQTKNTPLKIKNKIRYPATFESKYEKYTREGNYIDINNEIRELADELFEKETDLFHAVYKTAKWVETNVPYDLNTLTEKVVQKSSWVLKNKQGVCDEITNLFISILRAKGIPAKFISGMVYSPTEQKFANHGWAEVYLQNYGWLPFDPTFSQYGWIDATHIKLAESTDSGIASIEYSWKSSDIEVNINKLEINANIKDLKENILPVLTTAIEPYKTKVGLGSYVPVKITVENPTSFYIIPTIHLSKAPPIEGKNKRTLFLKPNDIKSTYFVIKVPKKLNENYIFRSEIEAKTSFGTPTSSRIEISNNYAVITKEEAESIISKYLIKEEKKEFTEIDFGCTTKETTYYEDENIEVICIIKNREKETKDLDVCLATDCRDTILTELEEKILIFKIKSSNKIITTVENNDKIKYSTINLELIKIPNIVVKNIEPLIIDYNEEVDLKIEVETTIPAHDVIIYLGKQEILNTNILQGKKEITVKVKGKDLISDIKLKSVYKDKLNKEYSKTEKYLITIKNKPWYIWLFGWML